MSDRKFCEWEWSEGKISVTVEVRVKYGQEGYALNNIKAGPPVFYINHPTPRIVAESGDLTVLAKEFERQAAAWYKIEWKLVLRLHTSRQLREGSFRFDVRYETYEMCVNPAGGMMFRQPSERHSTGFRYHQAIEGIFFPDTPENRAFLDKGLEMVRCHVDEALGKLFNRQFASNPQTSPEPKLQVAELQLWNLDDGKPIDVATLGGYHRIHNWRKAGPFQALIEGTVVLDNKGCAITPEHIDWDDIERTANFSPTAAQSPATA